MLKELGYASEIEKLDDFDFKAFTLIHNELLTLRAKFANKGSVDVE